MMMAHGAASSRTPPIVSVVSSFRRRFLVSFLDHPFFLLRLAPALPSPLSFRFGFRGPHFLLSFWGVTRGCGR